jgi:hypothetical protein
MGRAVALPLAVALLACVLASAMSAATASADPPSASLPNLMALMAVQQAQLTGTGGAAGDVFGYSVAISGGTALVGAAFDTVGGTAQQGSVYVFTRSGASWSQQAQLTAADGAANDNFGTSVAISGDTALVAASNDDVGASIDQGSVYIFTRSGSSWSQQAQLMAADGAASDHFGTRVALSGDTALAGALGDDVGASAEQGSAYVFTRSGASWSQQAKLTAADGAADDYLGSSVAISAETALVSAPHDTVSGNAYQGSAYVFARSGASWSQQAQLKAADGAAGDWFGSSVSIFGDSAVVGSPHDTLGSNTYQGSAYVFARSGNGWSQQAKLTASDGAANDNFGWSVALSGDTVLVAAPYDTVGGNSSQGSACVFPLDSTAPTSTATKNVTVIKGRKATLLYKIDDRLPSCGMATVTITIKLKAQIVKTIRITGVPTNEASSYSFKVTLKKGSYTWTVEATDIAGNVGEACAAKKLIVK